MSDVGTVNEWVTLANQQERGEDNCIPHFYIEYKTDKKETEKEGRLVTKPVHMVEVITPGDKLNIPVFKVTDEHKQRWPDAWKKFERTHEDVYGDGTPIQDWPYVNRGQVMELKALGIHTVEAAAGLSDMGVQEIGPGAWELRDRAKQFLQPQTDTETELRGQVQELQAQLAELIADKERTVLGDDGEPTTMEAVKRRPGRPKGSKNRPKE